MKDLAIEIPTASLADGYLSNLALLIKKIDLNAIERIVAKINEIRENDGMVYLAGNGGSSATASHLANDLGKTIRKGNNKLLRVSCLSDNTPWFTALANDEGYDCVFAGQLENFAKPNDLLIVISASGNSKNLIKAVDLAKSRGVYTIGFLGFDGGVLKDIVDDYLWIPTEKGEYQLVEDIHSILCHVLTVCLSAK